MNIAVVIACVFSCFSRSEGGDIDQNLDKALKAYAHAEQASSIEVAQSGFNEALRGFVEVGRRHTSSRVLFNTGNCLYQLDQLPGAIYAFEQAKRLSPREPKIHYHLEMARAQLGIQPDPPSWLDACLLKGALSDKERVVYASVGAFLAALLGSVALWTGGKVFHKVGAVFWAICGYMVVTLFTLHYLVPADGVIVEPAALRCDAGEVYSPVTDQILRSGQMVPVLKVSGEWVLVKNSQGIKGYIPLKSVRIL